MKAFDLVHPTGALGKQLVSAGRLTYQALLQPALRPKALSALALLAQAELSPHWQYGLLQFYLALGARQSALELLPRMCRADPGMCNDLAVDPVWKSLRGGARFAQLSQKYNTIAPPQAPAASASR